MRPPGLTLYQTPGCMYCTRVLAAAKDLGIELEARNVWVDAEAAAQLRAATGRQTVPVLRIDSEADTQGDGPRWMSESAEIVTYLYAQFGDGKRPGLLASLNPQIVLMAATMGAIALDRVVQPAAPWPWLIPIVAFIWVLKR